MGQEQNQKQRPLQYYGWEDYKRLFEAATATVTAAVAEGETPDYVEHKKLTDLVEHTRLSGLQAVHVKDVAAGQVQVQDPDLDLADPKNWTVVGDPRQRLSRQWSEWSEGQALLWHLNERNSQ